MLRLVLRVIGGLLAAVALVEAFFAMCFRLEGSDELRMVERLDFELGAVFTLAFVLLLGPSRLKAPWAWLLTGVGAGLLWACVSGSLIWSHREQHRIRSAPPQYLQARPPGSAVHRTAAAGSDCQLECHRAAAAGDLVVRREGEFSYGVVRDASARDYEARRPGFWRPGTRRTVRARRGEAASSETAPGAYRLLANLHQRRGTRLLCRELGAGRPGEADPRPDRESARRCRDVAPLYWYLDPEYYYSQYRSASETDDGTDRDIFTTLEGIERQITKSEYKTASVPFDPKGHITMSDGRAEFARPIPEVMYRPITG